MTFSEQHPEKRVPSPHLAAIQEFRSQLSFFRKSPDPLVLAEQKVRGVALLEVLSMALAAPKSIVDPHDVVQTLEAIEEQVGYLRMSESIREMFLEKLALLKSNV